MYMKKLYFSFREGDNEGIPYEISITVAYRKTVHFVDGVYRFDIIKNQPF
jgi:hypothetical protein